MANIISDETIEYVGILAKLELSDEEKEQAKKVFQGLFFALITVALLTIIGYCIL